MQDNIKEVGVAAAYKLYSSAGDKAIDTYTAASVAGKTSPEIILAMETNIVEVLPDARAANQLMHVDRDGHDVVDVAELSVPADKRTALIKVARESGAFYRFLGPMDGEKGCDHFGFRKP
ncbi:MAG: hypothetical protein RLZZ15_566 [Verrucomicrobiota bacterium]